MKGPGGDREKQRRQRASWSSQAQRFGSKQVCGKSLKLSLGWGSHPTVQALFNFSPCGLGSLLNP